MKTVEVEYVPGKKKLACASCYEYVENCLGCEWHNCAICGEELSDSEAYEYRGAIACATHHEEMIKKRDYQRQQIIENTDKQIRSQADGEWMNGGYKNMKVDAGGRPITKIKEPQDIKDYEDGKL